MCVCFLVVSECVTHVPRYTQRDRKRTLGVFLYHFPPCSLRQVISVLLTSPFAALEANMCCYAQNATWTPDSGPPTYPYPLTSHPIPTKQ